MKKKIIALTLIFAMLVPFVPAAAAEETAERPTVEEILSQYHQAAFEAEMNGEEAAAYSPRSGSNEPTLEQQTVDTLNEAGYEAYNVTADNYETLEEQLQTDFADMGLDPEGSYIIVIHGEEEQPQNGNARLGDLILPPHEYDNGDSNAFSYYCSDNGKTYQMRYVTVTANTNTNLRQVTPINLLTEYGAVDMWKDLELPISIATSLGLLPYTGTIYSLFTDIVLNTSPRQADSLIFKAGTNWTVTYTQVKITQTEQWRMSASIEYVKMRYFLDYTYYDYTTNQYEEDDIEGTYGTMYSSLYNDKETMKEHAALAYENNSYWHDTVDYVEYDIGDDTTISHYRWDEP